MNLLTAKDAHVLAGVAALHLPEEFWQKAFQRAGASNGAIELHYMPMKGTEISSQTAVVDATARGTMALLDSGTGLAIVIPAATERIVGICRTAPINFGDSGTNTSTNNSTNGAATFTDTLQVGDTLTWGLRTRDSVYRANNSGGALFHIPDAQPTTNVLIKQGKGLLTSLNYTNRSLTAEAFLKGYDLGRAANNAAVFDTPLFTLSVPAGQTLSLDCSKDGIQFTNGFTIRGTGLFAVTDTTALTTNQLIVTGTTK